MQHPSLIERSVGATLRAYSKGQVTREEAELDLVELIASQMFGKTDYSVAVIAYYVRKVLTTLSTGKMALADAFDTLSDAAMVAGEGSQPVSLWLAQPFVRSSDSGDRRLSA